MASCDYEICADCLRKLTYIGENDRHEEGVLCMECAYQRVKSERERILKIIGEVRGQLETTHNEKYKDTNAGYIIAAYDFEHLLKHKLAEERGDE